MKAAGGRRHQRPERALRANEDAVADDRGVRDAEARGKARRVRSPQIHGRIERHYGAWDRGSAGEIKMPRPSKSIKISIFIPRSRLLVRG